MSRKKKKRINIVDRISQYFSDFEKDYSPHKKFLYTVFHLFFLTMLFTFSTIAGEKSFTSHFDNMKLPLAFFVLSIYLLFLFEKKFSFKSFIKDRILEICSCFLGLIFAIFFGLRLPLDDIISSFSGSTMSTGYSIFSLVILFFIFYNEKKENHRLLLFSLVLSLIFCIILIFRNKNIDGSVISIVQLSVPIFTSYYLFKKNKQNSHIH